jgi:hypothetical protein
MTENKDSHEIEEYGDPGIRSLDAKVPTFLKWTYITLPIWGIIAFALYWNGSSGWLDRGYWRQLQNAAKTTFPIVNFDSPPEKNSQDISSK